MPEKLGYLDGVKYEIIIFNICSYSLYKVKSF